MAKPNVSAVISGANFMVNFMKILDHHVRKQGGTDTDIYNLVRPEGEAYIRDFARKLVHKQPVERELEYIDCDGEPRVDEGFEVEMHRRGGLLAVDDLNKVRLLSTRNTLKSDIRNGKSFRREISNKPLLNACVLDFLDDHQDMIPESWKEREEHIFFWGTIYRYRKSESDQLYVRFMHWCGGRWYWNFSHLQGSDRSGHMCAVLPN